MSCLGILMAFGGFLYAVAVIIGRLVGSVTPGIGFAALMSVLLVGQGSILIMLGILGEYLWRTYDEARGRPRYLIEEFVSSDGCSAPTRHDPTTTEPNGAADPEQHELE
jgi:dolichol-phosphate mannosyltransferase